MAVTKITITTSSELSTSKRVEIEKRLIEKYGEIVAIYHVDEAIVGGIIIFDGKTAYDGSIKASLEKIKDQFINKLNDNK